MCRAIALFLHKSSLVNVTVELDINAKVDGSAAQKCNLIDTRNARNRSASKSVLSLQVH
jgi:hypothetical protein